MSLSLLLANARAQLKGGRGGTPLLQRLYTPGFLQPGDIALQMVDDTAGHALMVAPDPTRCIHSVYSDGVSYAPSLPFSLRLYRYQGPDDANDPIAQRAAFLAQGWVGKVKYGDGSPWRAFGAAFGSSNFGRGAHARLLKYRGREEATSMGVVMEHARPKNAICSELCILVYQLVSAENAPSFIRLDAKHATPEVLRRYFDANQGAWKCILD
jgi:hypothetical protein